MNEIKDLLVGACENDRQERENYKEMLIDMINSIEDCKFLRQLYTIIHQYMKRAETT